MRYLDLPMEILKGVFIFGSAMSILVDSVVLSY